ncbi:uncharacterized [Tachysurus ichikawai]
MVKSGIRKELGAQLYSFTLRSHGGRGTLVHFDRQCYVCKGLGLSDGRGRHFEAIDMQLARAWPPLDTSNGSSAYELEQQDSLLGICHTNLFSC